MTPSSQFEITRRLPGHNASLKWPAGLSLPASGVVQAHRGTMVGVDSTDPEAAALATHNNFIGFLTRRVLIGGLSLTDRVFGVTSDNPVGVEAPFKSGEEISLEKALEVECEGSFYLYSGTGQITSLTAVPSSLSFINGQVRVAQSGEIVRATLTANNLTSTDGTSLRIRMEMLL